MNRREEDLMLLNSYLDRELSESESLRFTKRIAAEPALTTDIEELLAVKSQLKRLGEVKAPRKYILTRAEAAEAKPPSWLERLFPAFRWSAAVSMFALMILMLVPMMTSPSGTSPRLAEKSVTFADVAEEQDFSLESIAAGAIQPVSSTLRGSMTVGSAGAPQYFSSQGVRGGSPKLDVLGSAERKFPEDRTYFGGNIDEETEAAALAALNPTESEHVDAPISIRKVLIWASAIMLAMSAAWITATLGRRAWARH